MREFYVYLHKRKSDGAVFYVGKGTGRRAYRTAGRSEWWHRVASKHGFKVEIIFFGTEADCFDVERAKIALFRSSGEPIVNASDGGDGSANPTPEARAKLSARQKARFADPREREKIRVTKTTPEARAAQSERRKKAMSNPEARMAVSEKMKEVWAKRKEAGTVIFTQEVKAKLSASQTARWSKESEREKQREAQRRNAARRAERNTPV